MSTPHYLLTNVCRSADIHRGSKATHKHGRAHLCGGRRTDLKQDLSSCAAWREIILKWSWCKVNLGHSQRWTPVSLCSVSSWPHQSARTDFSSLREFLMELYKGVCVKSLCEEGRRWRAVRGEKSCCVPRWSVSGSGVWLGPRRWRRLCCIPRARRRTVSRRCASANGFWDSPDGSRP